jgi:hypothetical protein
MDAARVPKAGDVVDYRLTGGGARRLNAQHGAGTVTAGDWHTARVTATRKHASRDEAVISGTVVGPNGAAWIGFDGAVAGDEFGCWRWPSKAEA